MPANFHPQSVCLTNYWATANWFVQAQLPKQTPGCLEEAGGHVAEMLILQHADWGPVSLTLTPRQRKKQVVACGNPFWIYIYRESSFCGVKCIIYIYQYILAVASTFWTNHHTLSVAWVQYIYIYIINHRYFELLAPGSLGNVSRFRSAAGACVLFAVLFCTEPSPQMTKYGPNMTQVLADSGGLSWLIHAYLLTLWWTNRAMENHHFWWENPL